MPNAQVRPTVNAQGRRRLPTARYFAGAAAGVIGFWQPRPFWPCSAMRTAKATRLLSIHTAVFAAIERASQGSPSIRLSSLPRVPWALQPPSTSLRRIP